jgi:hypothetical protein
MRNKKLITTMMAVLAVILLAASGLTVSPPTAADDTSCIYFEDLSLGTQYHVGDTFTESGVFIKVDSFQWSNGQWTDNGYASVGNEGLGGGSGQEVFLNNVIMHFDFGGPCEGLSLLYGAYGGNLNIDINGDFRNFDVFDDIGGSTIGGVNVAINNFGSGKGSLTLSGTIEGFFIGGQELVIDHVCSEVQPAEKPDLIITDVWSEDSTICYQIRNTGAAVARAGHYTGLSIDGVEDILDYIAVDLAPGERLKRCLDYDWVCTAAGDTIKVCADYSDDIAESDEANNYREETWKCDSTPPRIISGPTVSKITTNSAVVSWDTDEASDSAVTYDRAAGKYDFEKTASSLVRNHEITLTDLEPSTTYHFVVQSTDSSGHTIQSKDIAFETLPSPDYEDPVISTVDQAGCTGMSTITAAASDNIGVEKVEFYLEGDLVYTDYSPSSPYYELPFDTSLYASGSYDLEVRAVDSYGNYVQMDRQIEVCDLPIDIEPPLVLFTNPKPWDTVSGNVTVEVEASDDFAVDRVYFFIDDWCEWCDTTFPYTYPWDTTTVENGTRIIMARADDSSLNSHSASVTVTVDNPPPPKPILVLRNLSYTQYGNYFETVFEVCNTGTADATDVLMKVCNRGFQCVSETDVVSPNNAVYNVSASYSVEDSMSCAKITYDGTLAPNATDYITVNLVPILYPYAVPFGYMMGVSFEVNYGPHGPRGPWTHSGRLVTLEVPAVDSAFGSADYLIVTNPENLFLFNGSVAAVNNLLSAMAELAMLKNGVLGYFYAPASFSANIGRLDLMACGDVDGDGRADIIVARDYDGTVDVYGKINLRNWGDPLFGTAGLKAGSVPTTYDGPGVPSVGEWMAGTAPPFDYGDGLACGDVDQDTRAEIIVAENSGSTAGWVDIYGYELTSSGKWEYCLEASLQTSFDDGDGLACANVDQDGEAEIIVADHDTGMVDIYSIYSTGASDTEYSVATNFSGPQQPFTGRDGLACGDVDQDGKAEIIVGDARTGKVEIYDTTGLEASNDTAFDANVISSVMHPGYNRDGLACGDVDGEGVAEIVVANDETGSVDIWSGGDQLPCVDTSFNYYDHLACGDVDGDGQEEIIVADNEWGWIDVITYGRSHAGDRDRLSDLIKVGGLWSDQLSPGWTENGYLLIVGETEIIPSGTSTHEYDPWETLHVRCTDIKYANTEGKWVYPELNIGRIIGNNAQALTVPIEASIGVCLNLTGYEFDRSDALVMSGTGNGWRYFRDNVNDVKEILDYYGQGGDQFNNVVRILWTDYDDNNQRLQVFNSSVPNKDVIYFSDHCNSDSWHPALDKSHVSTIDFGNARPFVYASCCQAGRYAGITGIAEYFLYYGAGAYIGATEDAKYPYMCNCAEKFFLKWCPYDRNIGLAFKLVKIELAEGFWGAISYNRFQRRYWLSEFQLYGDPKYGGSSVSNCTGLMALTETEIQGPLSSLDVIVPDYEVTTVEGEDHVEIPGGDMFIVPSRPLVPFYTMSLNYPQGYEVQGVVLTDMSGLTTATGLNIPNATVGTAGETSSGAMGGSEGSEWWPEDVFYWNLFDNADGSSTLAIAMSPFYYNPLTTDVRFYKNYSFDIDYTVSTVEISRLETDKHVYEQGEQVLVDLEINNSAAQAKDVLVDAVIEAESSGEIVGGLLLRTLKGLAGPAYFSPHWDSNGFEPGYYYVRVTLKDTAGNVLDRKTEMFRLGISSGEITSFTATPESFDIGDEIDISLAFNNIGTVDISGTALIRVQDEAGDIVQEFSHNVTGLAPDDSVSFDDTWDTSGAEQGTYHINGLVFYDGQAAGSEITANFEEEEPSDEEPSGGACFIATAAYGTPMAEEIEILRDFRDVYLLTNPVGQALVDLYYRVSPPIAEFITEHPSLKPMVRAGLLPAVAMSTVAVNTTRAEKAAIVGFVALVSLAVTLWATRRRARSGEHA